MIAVPIPAVAVRELIYDAKGKSSSSRRGRQAARAAGRRAPAELEPGQTREEAEGVFLVRNDRAEFIPIKIGIAGDRYFEVLRTQSRRSGDYRARSDSVRGMADGDPVTVRLREQEATEHPECS